MSSWYEYFNDNIYQRKTICVENRSSEILIDESILFIYSTFSDIKNSGVILISSPKNQISVLIERSVFDACTNINEGGCVRAAFDNKSTFCIARSCFSRCESKNRASVSSLYGSSNINLRSYFEFNVVFDIQSSVTDVIRFEYCEVSIKSCNSSGINTTLVSGFSIPSSSLSCSFSTYSNSVQNGCVNFMYPSSTASVSFCNFVNNLQTQGGHYEGIFMITVGSVGYISHCAFVRNTGQLINTYSSQVTLSFCYTDSLIKNDAVTFYQTIVSDSTIELPLVKKKPYQVYICSKPGIKTFMCKKITLFSFVCICYCF